jgi:short-subunit dehydrogenase
VAQACEWDTLLFVIARSGAVLHSHSARRLDRLQTHAEALRQQYRIDVVEQVDLPDVAAVIQLHQRLTPSTHEFRRFFGQYSTFNVRIA